MLTVPKPAQSSRPSFVETLRQSVSFVVAGLRERIALADLLRWGLLGCTLLSFGLGFLLWDRFPLREDEAIYGFWALHAAQVDPWFLTVWPDKPPLFLWSLAGALELLGASPASARFLNNAITALTVPVVAGVARRLWGAGAGLWAAVTFTLNPFARSFAPTVFTDPMLVLWGLLALSATLARRPFWAGICLGAAIMTKQQGLLFVPLVAMVCGKCTMDNAQCTMGGGGGGWAGQAGRLVAGVALVALPIVWWDSQRWAVAPSPWDLGMRNYGGLALLPPEAWLPRWRIWADLFWHLAGSWPVWIGLAAMLNARWTMDNGQCTMRNGIPRPSPLAPRNSPLLLWAGGFVAFHLFTTVQPWDRYLLPLAPGVALLAAWAGSGLVRRWGRRTGALVGLIWLCLLLPPGVQAAQGRMPLGGDHGDYAGFDAALTWFQTHAPEDAVLYHQELGWHYRFYLFGQTTETGGGYDLRWSPSAVYLADNGAKTPHRPKFLIQPAWAATRNQARYLPMREMAWLPRFQAERFTVYEIVTPPGRPCDWCLCDLPQKGRAP